MMASSKSKEEGNPVLFMDLTKDAEIDEQIFMIQNKLRRFKDRYQNNSKIVDFAAETQKNKALQDLNHNIGRNFESTPRKNRINTQQQKDKIEILDLSKGDSVHVKENLIHNFPGMLGEDYDQIRIEMKEQERSFQRQGNNESYYDPRQGHSSKDREQHRRDLGRQRQRQAHLHPYHDRQQLHYQQQQHHQHQDQRHAQQQHHHHQQQDQHHAQQQQQQHVNLAKINFEKELIVQEKDKELQDLKQFYENEMAQLREDSKQEINHLEAELENMRNKREFYADNNDHSIDDTRNNDNHTNGGSQTSIQAIDDVSDIVFSQQQKDDNDSVKNEAIVPLNLKQSPEAELEAVHRESQQKIREVQLEMKHLATKLQEEKEMMKQEIIAEYEKKLLVLSSSSSSSTISSISSPPQLSEQQQQQQELQLQQYKNHYEKKAQLVQVSLEEEMHAKLESEKLAQELVLNQENEEKNSARLSQLREELKAEYDEYRTNLEATFERKIVEKEKLMEESLALQSNLDHEQTIEECQKKMNENFEKTLAVAKDDYEKKVTVLGNDYESKVAGLTRDYETKVAALVNDSDAKVALAEKEMQQKLELQFRKEMDLIKNGDQHELVKMKEHFVSELELKEKAMEKEKRRLLENIEDKDAQLEERKMKCSQFEGEVRAKNELLKDQVEKFREMKQGLESLKAREQSLLLKIDQFQADTNDRIDEICRLTDENKGLKMEIEKVSLEKNDLVSRLDQVEKEMEAAIDQKLNEIRQWTAQNVGLETKIEEISVEKSELVARLEEIVKEKENEEQAYLSEKDAARMHHESQLEELKFIHQQSMAENEAARQNEVQDLKQDMSNLVQEQKNLLQEKSESYDKTILQFETREKEQRIFYENTIETLRMESETHWNELQNAIQNHKEEKEELIRSHQEVIQKMQRLHENEVDNLARETVKLREDNEREKAEVDLNHAYALKKVEDSYTTILQQKEEDILHLQQSNANFKTKLNSTLSNVHQEILNLKRSHQTLADETSESLQMYFNNMFSASETVVSQCLATERKNENIINLLSEDFEKMEHQKIKIEDRYLTERKRRRLMQKMVIELRGNIRVHCRIRKILDMDLPETTATLHKVNEETLAVDIPCVKPTAGRTRGINGQLLTGEQKFKEYEFDKVYSGQENQENVFVDVVPYISSVIEGFNVCILAYGQTGSGKTHTMVGDKDKLDGIIPNASRELFELIEARQEIAKTTVRISMLEIYNNEIKDLLIDGKKQSHDKKYELNKDKTGNIVVSNLTSAEAADFPTLLQIISAGSKRRVSEKTNVHDHSSRSHFVITLIVDSEDLRTGTKTSSKMQLVDLAGSECVGNSGVRGKNLTESKNINKSLSALSDVLWAASKKHSHIPYRNSKLTYYLSDSIGGDAKMVLFVCVSPTNKYSGESTQSLTFGTRARKVEKGKAKINRN